MSDRPPNYVFSTQFDAAVRLARQDSDDWRTLAPLMTCNQADAFADFLASWGPPTGAAEAFLTAHSEATACRSDHLAADPSGVDR